MALGRGLTLPRAGAVMEVVAAAVEGMPGMPEGVEMLEAVVPLLARQLLIVFLSRRGVQVR